MRDRKRAKALCARCADEALRSALEELTQSAAAVLLAKSIEVAGKLSEDERDRFTGAVTFAPLRQVEKPFRLARILLCACADEIEWQFSAECIKRDIRRVRRLRKQRYA